MQTLTDLDTFTADSVKLAKANDFVRFISCLYETRDVNPFATTTDAFAVRRAAELFLHRWPGSFNRDVVAKALDLDLVLKAAVNPGTTLEPAWAAPLAIVRPLSDGFLELSRVRSLLGQVIALGSRQAPFNTSVPSQTAGASYGWVGEGAPKPVSDVRFSSATLGIAKAAGTIVVTAELLKLASPASVGLLRRDFAAGLNAFLDAQFTDPTVTATATNPASITASASSFGSAGTSSGNALTDFKKLVAQFFAVNPDAENIVVLTSPAMAVALAVAAAASTLGATGGELYGVRVVTGNTGSRLIALDPAGLIVADDGDITVSVSAQGTVEMETAPTSPPTASTVMVSLWQNNLAGIRVERFLNYRVRPGSVVYTNVAWV